MAKSVDRIFVIGDVHGCAEELKTLIRQLPLTFDSLIIFLGDYVDRGPDAKGVIDYILHLKEHYHVVTLRGNHEEMFEAFLSKPESEMGGLFILNGGSATLASYETEDGKFAIPTSHINFIRDCHLFFQTKDHFFVHGGVPLNRDLNLIDAIADRETLLWSREPFLSHKGKWNKLVIHGHTPTLEPEIFENRIGLDTGCVFGNKLTALEIPAMKYHFSAKDKKPTQKFLLAESFANQRHAARFKGAIPIEVQREGGNLACETINFNEFGFLLRSVDQSEVDLFKDGEILEGWAGSDPDHRVWFCSEVMRKDQRPNGFYYGVKVLKLRYLDRETL